MCCPLSGGTVSHNSGVVLWICAATYRLSVLVTIGCSIMCCPISVVPDSHNIGGLMDMCCSYRLSLVITILVVLWICAAPIG